MWNLFLFYNHSWNYVGTFSNYDIAVKCRDAVKENHRNMCCIEQVKNIGSFGHFEEMFEDAVNKKLLPDTDPNSVDNITKAIEEAHEALRSQP